MWDFRLSRQMHEAWQVCCNSKSWIGKILAANFYSRLSVSVLNKLTILGGGGGRGYILDAWYYKMLGIVEH